MTILLRLPEKSVVRFRCVSKLWSSITTDLCFINLFETRSQRPSLLLCFRKDGNMFVSSIQQHSDRHTPRHNSNKSFSSSQAQPIVRYQTKFPEDDGRFSTTESVNGLICFQESGNPVVWNPSKREFLTLTNPSWNHITVFLGYDPIERKHKVLCVPYEKSSKACQVLTLGSAQGSWRTVKTTHRHHSLCHTSGRCIKGFIYYFAYIDHTRGWVIMSFDVRSEKFNMIQLSWDIDWGLLINYGERLACFDKYDKRRLWILEDAGEHKWSSQDFILPLRRHFDEISGDTLILKGITYAGEFIFAPTMFSKSSYILYYDPVTNSCRRFELERIVGNEYGLGNDGWNFALHAFPNHIDGQVSM